MKSSFNKGDVVNTTKKASGKIRKGKLNEPLIESGTVVGNEHYGRVVVVKLISGEIAKTKPDYLELQ